MTQLNKALEKFYRKPIPKDITIEDIIYLAEQMGCVIKSGGKHPIKVVHIQSGTVIPIPVHGKYVKEAYVKQVKDLFNEIR